MRHGTSRVENEVHVEEVRVGWARYKQVATAREIGIGIVVVEPSTRVRSPALPCPAVDDRARGVGRSVGAVGPGGEDDEIIGGGGPPGGGQRPLPAATPTAPPPQGHPRLAPRDETGPRRPTPAHRPPG